MTDGHKTVLKQKEKKKTNGRGHNVAQKTKKNK